MSKAVMISIQSKWCELIVNGKKTIEVRKTKPKLETPFKVYIYCTYGQGLIENNDLCYPNMLLDQKVSKNAIWGNCCNGKVIGEFVCNQIDTYDDDTIHAFSREDYSKWNDFDLYNSCIHSEDFEHYANDNWLYGWHISNLVIYDKPRELGEFRSYNTRAYFDEEIRLPMPTHEISRPPQSWCYVEDFANE